MSEVKRDTVMLITDFGDSPYTGIMRAVIKSIGPDIEIIDGTHSVPSFNVLAGAYVVFNMYRWAPKGSVITVVVDPGVGGARAPVAIRAGDYYFVGPDNGVLFPSLVREGFKHGVEIDPSRLIEIASKRFRGKLGPRGWTVSYTFHGRDIFAPTAALIATGEAELEDLGTPLSLTDMKKLSLDYVERTEEGYRMKVVYVDKYGNVALSAQQGSVPFSSWKGVVIGTPDGRSIQATAGRKFSDVPPGDLVVYINSFGFLEIAANMDNASRRLGVTIGDRLTLTPV